jgi:hypothetical protein
MYEVRIILKYMLQTLLSALFNLAKLNACNTYQKVQVQNPNILPTECMYVFCWVHSTVGTVLYKIQLIFRVQSIKSNLRTPGIMVPPRQASRVTKDICDTTHCFHTDKQILCPIKYIRASSHVRWLNGE